MEGIKFDTDKPRMELLPFEALQEVAKILTYGAKKYAPDNWKLLKDPVNRYSGAMLRHLSAALSGEKYDKESGLSHLSHAACNALFLVWFEKQAEKITGADNAAIQ